MKILITGISGRIGANLAKSFVEAGHDVRGLIWANDRRSEKLHGLDIELIEGTIENFSDTEKAVAGVDAICHLAAAFQGGGPFSNTQYFEINVNGTFNMLEAARQHAPNLQHFFYASTDAIYDKYPPSGMLEPIQEDRIRIAPTGQYSITKYLGEELGRGYYRTYQMPVTIFRFAMAWAGDEVLNFRQFYLNHWLETFAKLPGEKAAATYEQLKKLCPTNSEDAKNCLLIARDENGRSYKKHVADVRDIVRGFTDALGKPGVIGEVFQLAAPVPYTWEATIPYLAQKLGVDYVDARLDGTNPTFYEFDMSRGRRLFGYKPSYDIFSMIDDAVAFQEGQSAGVIPTHLR